MLTLTQLSKLADTEGIDLFEGLRLPDGSPLDRDTLINSIMLKCGLNIPNFADPYVMQSAITLWSAQNQYTFDHVAKIYLASYSPIENYDRYEDMETNRNRTATDNTAHTGTKTDSISTDKTAKHTGTDTTTDEQQTSAYDATTYQPVDKTTSSLLHGETINDKGTSTKTTVNNLNTDKDIEEGERTTQANHIRGNIGIVSAMSMQQEEYDMLSKYNPYEFLAGLFENSLTLFVY